MTDDACRGKCEDIGAYVLGTLDGNRATALIAHLDGCPSCRAEADELADIARLLPLADPLRASDQPMPPSRLGESIVRRVKTEDRNTRRQRLRRAGALGLGVAAAIVALIAYFAITSPEVVEIDFGSETTSAQSHAALEYLPGGTRISLSVEGLPQEETFGVWLEKGDGERVPAGSFYTPDDGQLELTLTAAIRLKDCNGIGVSDSNGETILYAALD